ncbi:uncharacterized protein LACBIDRAFT_313016 [Laccaria bicolor S238N-H82]|uniref:Predicted protein n=1 Tax=Laccaria bicolor (strain S238N-H82 / ATCC MYA-4686) TaxID=486041 RepID=B0DXC7_LACBS|nr:uncharacterized protein LACBIDRAFT_313016 [Laccaria bicolor S238N-H82]EDR00813.1 predicted protein [Laccaria bicolor S238N-H82]|eukprot:XP_001888605.1 predicted protein [Laccaria bicolor S238N-H82]
MNRGSLQTKFSNFENKQRRKGKCQRDKKTGREPSSNPTPQKHLAFLLVLLNALSSLPTSLIVAHSPDSVPIAVADKHDVRLAA